MLLTSPSAEMTPHLAALRQAADAGFRFRHLRDGRSEIAAIHAERWCDYGVVETITLRAMTEAISARIRIEDYPNGDRFWERTGTVVEVITELLALPPHGS